MNNDLKNRLGRINWDFETRLVVDTDDIFPFNNRKYHSYPATYIPEIPFSLIEILSEKGSVVMDPFGGIGTTFIQALIQKRIPISIDNNSIASHITNDFYVMFNPCIDLDKALEEIKNIVDKYDVNTTYINNSTKKNKLFDGWYENNTLNQIAFLIQEYDRAKNDTNIPGLLELFHLCLSNLLTTVCSQNGGWAYIADNVKPKKHELKDKNAIFRFLINIDTCVKSINGYKLKLGNDISFVYDCNTLSKVICEDFSNMDIGFLREKVDLIVTSPPYPRMIDYVKSQRLTFYLEGRDFANELSSEIGARARRNQSDTMEKYIYSMKKCNDRIYASLKKGGYLCYVLPDFSSEKKRDRKDAIDEVIKDCREKGLEITFKLNRSIPGTKRSNNIKWASLKQEQIIVMEKL